MTSNAIKLETIFFNAEDNQVSHAPNHRTLDKQHFIKQTFLSVPLYRYETSLGARN
jgi:hypothetical protein